VNFHDAIRVVLKSEGGSTLTDDKFDPGGATRWGISSRAHPSVDVKALTRDDAVRLYKTHYWNAVSCSALPDCLSLPVFDCAVNQGVQTAGLLLQRALNRAGATIAEDGDVGPQTLAATLQTNPGDARAWFLSLRAHRYGQSGNFRRYGLGWMRRLFTLP